MDCVDDSNLKPQKEEGIVEARWMNKREVEIAMTNTFATIQSVIITYFENPMLHEDRSGIKPIQKVHGFK